jgi:hypothetical protein
MKNDSSLKLDDIIYSCEYDYCRLFPNVTSVVCYQASMLASLCLSKYQLSISYMEENFCRKL